MRKLAIVGTHTRTRNDAPWLDPEFDIWVFNEAPQQSWCKRWDAAFQMHKPEVYTSPHNFVRGDHWDWLQQSRGKPVIMQAHDARVPDCVVYPLDKIHACVPGAKLDWYKSTPAYAIAYALYSGYQHIDCYGLDMASNTEYGYQLPNFQFWIGVALGMGVKIGVLSNEQYFTSPLYAYDGEIQIDRTNFEARVQKYEAEIVHATKEERKAQSKFHQALFDAKYEIAGTCLSDWQTFAVQLGEYEGKLAEARRYMGRDDLIPRQEFERCSAQAQLNSETARREMWEASGECQYIWNAWRQTGSLAARDQLKQFAEKRIRLAILHGQESGKCEENHDYMIEIDGLITAHGGQKTLISLGVA